MIEKYIKMATEAGKSTKYDMHVHSFHSDGSEAPSVIMKRAKERGLGIVALTDHEGIGGIEEAQVTAKDLGLIFIPGIELSVRYDQKRLLHILGLEIDVHAEDFVTLYESYRKNREEALVSVVAQLQEKGFSITLEEAKEYCFNNKPDRHCVAKCLVAKGYAASISRAWIDILDDVPYEEKEILEPEEAFQMIRAGKGKSFLAHIHKGIGLYGYSDEEAYERLKALKELGLDGIEARYPTFDSTDLAFIEQAIEGLSLLKCGGSDFHGANRPEVDLGMIGESA
ncbi:MAG: PHP domain-containing protein [Vallitaleaceae bacterium]|nr:PHP domain-containing protein [Vallitaleaceae bacterium]